MIYFLLHRLVFMLAIGLLFSSPVWAQSADTLPLSQDISQDEPDNISVALEGYDVMTYYTPAGPQKGAPSYQALYNDKRYLFTSLENQQQFAKNPEKYLPEFEEYCGCAVSDNKQVMADPTVFKITQGKLVLFEDEQALSLWNKDEAGRYKKAQNFWKHENKYDANKRLRDDSRARLFSF